jgi:serine protease Do
MTMRALPCPRAARVPRRAFGWLFIWVAGLVVAPAHSGDQITTVANVKRSVVAIGTFVPTRSPQFAFRGTGFVIGDGNVVVTNAHVIPVLGDPKHLEMLGVLVPDGRAASATFREAKQVALDPTTDLALLQVGGEPLPALQIGDSDSVKEGQAILITGFPIGAVLGPFAATHRGLVAAIAPIAIPQGRSANLDPKIVHRLKSGAFNIFQLDATAYPGSSGSPVYDPDTGHVLAIVNMVLVKSTKEAVLSQPSGITYAVPAKYVTELLAKAR